MVTHHGLTGHLRGKKISESVINDGVIQITFVEGEKVEWRVGVSDIQVPKGELERVDYDGHSVLLYFSGGTLFSIPQDIQDREVKYIDDKAKVSRFKDLIIVDSEQKNRALVLRLFVALTAAFAIGAIVFWATTPSQTARYNFALIETALVVTASVLAFFSSQLKEARFEFNIKGFAGVASGALGAFLLVLLVISLRFPSADIQKELDGNREIRKKELEADASRNANLQQLLAKRESDDSSWIGAGEWKKQEKSVWDNFFGGVDRRKNEADLLWAAYNASSTETWENPELSSLVLFYYHPQAAKDLNASALTDSGIEMLKFQAFSGNGVGARGSHELFFDSWNTSQKEGEPEKFLFRMTDAGLQNITPPKESPATLQGDNVRCCIVAHYRGVYKTADGWYFLPRMFSNNPVKLSIDTAFSKSFSFANIDSKHPSMWAIRPRLSVAYNWKGTSEPPVSFNYLRAPVALHDLNDWVNARQEGSIPWWLQQFDNNVFTGPASSNEDKTWQGILRRWRNDMTGDLGLSDQEKNSATFGSVIGHFPIRFHSAEDKASDAIFFAYEYQIPTENSAGNQVSAAISRNGPPSAP